MSHFEVRITDADENLYKTIVKAETSAEAVGIGVKEMIVNTGLTCFTSIHVRYIPARLL